MNPFAIETSGPVTTIRFTDVSAGWEQWVLLRSDTHHDSVLCDRDLELEHLQLAKARNALIVDGGDLFDAMQSRHDKRRSGEELRPELAFTSDYFGALIEHTAADYAPYAGNFALLARGNHESSVLTHSGIDLLSQLQRELGRQGSPARVGGFDGWLLFRFVVQGTVIQTWRLRYFHGSGAAAPVTRGVLDTARQAVYLPDADIVLNGHNHAAYLVPIARERISGGGKVWQDLSWYVRTPGYKRRGEWEHEKGMSPNPRGRAGCAFG